MNIFYVDSNPIVAAQSLCDKHVVKMILESAQMLCTAHNELDGDSPTRYKSTHINHPSNKWVRNRLSNYGWLDEHFNALLQEYSYRYGKTHACFKFAFGIPPNYIEIDKPFIAPPQCMPEAYKQLDTVQAYRDYYNGEKLRFAKWTKRTPPIWIVNKQ